MGGNENPTIGREEGVRRRESQDDSVPAGHRHTHIYMRAPTIPPRGNYIARGSLFVGERRGSDKHHSTSVQTYMASMALPCLKKRNGRTGGGDGSPIQGLIDARSIN
jgi:hypothetical protein